MRAWPPHPPPTSPLVMRPSVRSHPPPPLSSSSHLSLPKSSKSSCDKDHAIDSQTALFQVLLDADAAIDHFKLRRAANSGIPIAIRKVVWPMLLGVTAFNSTHGGGGEEKREREYLKLVAGLGPGLEEVGRRVRGVLKRSKDAYCGGEGEKKVARHGSTSGDSYDDGKEEDEGGRGVIRNGARYGRGRQRHIRVVDRDVVDTFTRVIASYLDNVGDADIEFHVDMVYLCAPFVELMTEAESYYAFYALMQKWGNLYTEEGLQESVSQFIIMFRYLHRDLHEHFVGEEVEFKLWVAKWLRGLLVQQLPRSTLLRLWDSYFANGLHLHPFVCLVFIEHIKAELQECDDGEGITALLAKLKPLDVDYVMAHALSIREQLREGDIL